jgi:adenylate cyclase
MNLISGKGETSSRLPAFSLFLPGSCPNYRDRRTDRPAGEQMRFRIGIHVGDIMVQGDNLFGDAVNIAARLEALSEPSGICISGAVRDYVGGKLALTFAYLGERQVKNIAQPIKAYRVGGETSPTANSILGSSLPVPDSRL